MDSFSFDSSSIDRIRNFYQSNPIYSIWDESVGQWFDLGLWFMLQYHYWPHYVIGKQDAWRDWVGSSLNGWGPNTFSICKK